MSLRALPYCTALTRPYSPILLVERAKKMRKETGDDRWWAPFERTEISLKKRVENIVARPFKIFFREPMLIAITFYMSVSVFSWSNFIYPNDLTCLVYLWMHLSAIRSLSHRLYTGS